MTLDLAAGPGWPIASPVLTCADASGALCELTYGCMELAGGTHYEGCLPQRRVIREEGTPKRIAVMAYQWDTSDPEKNRQEGTIIKTAFGERTCRLPLMIDSYINLDHCVEESEKGARVVWDVPGTAKDRWMLFGFWQQPAAQKINGGRTYVADHLSAEGAKAVADYWEPLLKTGKYDAVESLFCDSLEYDVAQDWTPKLPELFRERMGYDLIPYLPFTGMCHTYPAGDVPAFLSSPETVGIQVNHDYMELLTQLYCEEHLGRLENMAEKYGKTVRYQVAYNKPFEEERCGLFVAIPENEALGRAQLDGQRLMAAAAHFGRKERYSFECAAEFGQSYGQSYEDLMWWIKRSLMAGMNAQVLHGGSYSGNCAGTNPESRLAKSVTWPGYEGFGRFISNNWNRTPDIRHARGCMDAVARLNGIFRKKARIDLCVFRQAYENSGLGEEFYLYDDNGRLTNGGYSYEYVSDYLLHLPQAEVKNGVLDAEGAAYRALIVPPQKRMSERAMSRIWHLAAQGLLVILIGGKPEEGLYRSEWLNEEQRERWAASRRRLWDSTSENVKHAADLWEVPEVLACCGVFPRVALRQGGDIMTAVRVEEDESRVWYALYGYNRIRTGEGFRGPGNAEPRDVKPVYQRPGKPSARMVEVALCGNGPVYIYDPWSGDRRSVPFAYDGAGRMRGKISIQEDEMVILSLDNDGRFFGSSLKTLSVPRSRKAGTLRFEQFSFYEFGPDTPEEMSFLRSHFAVAPLWSTALETEDALIPWHRMNPLLEGKAGAGLYRGILELDEEPSKGERLFVSLGDVYDTFTMQVNGKETPFPDQVMKRADVTGLAHKGRNEIVVRVVSELHNRLVREAVGSGKADPRTFYTARSYGICPSEAKPFTVAFEAGAIKT